MRRYLALLMLCLLAACALPREQARVAVTQVTESAMELPEGRAQPLRSWLPEGKPEAVILALHGFNDYSHAFEAPGNYLRARGIAVYAYDQRGFGDAPERGIWAGEENLTEDVAAALRYLRARYPGTPLYVLGESMGGAVAILAAAQGKLDGADGLILAAPAVWGGGSMNPFYRAALWMLAHIAPEKHLTGRGLKIQASDNIEMLRALGRDPKVIKRTRLDAVYGLTRLMGEAQARAGEVRLPALVLYGARDQVIPPQPVDEAAHKIRGPKVFAYYLSGWHMLLRDVQAEVVLADISGWIADPGGALPSGYERVRVAGR